MGKYDETDAEFAARLQRKLHPSPPQIASMQEMVDDLAAVKKAVDPTPTPSPFPRPVVHPHGGMVRPLAIGAMQGRLDPEVDAPYRNSDMERHGIVTGAVTTSDGRRWTRVSHGAPKGGIQVWWRTADLVEMTPPQPAVQGNGKNVVITGKIGTYTRNVLHRMLRRHGYTPQMVVNGKTHVLLIGERPGDGKLTDAKRHHTKTGIMKTDRQFRDWLAKNNRGRV